jgi:hypothetical protein
MTEPPPSIDHLYPGGQRSGAVPFGAGDGEGDLGEAVIGLAVPGKTVSHHHYPLGPSVPLPDQNRARSKLGPFLVKAGQAGGHCRSGFARNRSIQYLPGCVIEVAEAVSLEPIGDDRK